MHCNQTDCIGCFGNECQSVRNGQCYTLSGTYCGDCHDCFDEDITTNNRNNRNQGGHTHQVPAHRHFIMTEDNGGGAVAGSGYTYPTTYSGIDYGSGYDDINFFQPIYGDQTTTQAGTHTHRRGLGNTIGRNGNTNGNQTNLRARQGEFVNRRTGNSVPAGTPYHTHEGQAMAGARHSNKPHDKYDRVGGGMGRVTPTHNMSAKDVGINVYTSRTSPTNTQQSFGVDHQCTGGEVLLVHATHQNFLTQYLMNFITNGYHPNVSVVPCSTLNGTGWACDSMCQADEAGESGGMSMFINTECSGLTSISTDPYWLLLPQGQCNLESVSLPGYID